MNFAAKLLHWAGWRLTVTVPNPPKCIICVAPHTTNWDFVLGKLAYAAVGRRAGFLMKSQWFVWPLGYFFRAIGGIPVVRKNRKTSLVEAVSAQLRSATGRMQIAITPEGTRSPNADWHTGFLRIALEAGVPIQLAVLDYGHKHVYITEIFEPTGDIESDLRAVKDYYRSTGCIAYRPEKFVL